jgi:hypothetical protein
VIARLFGVRRGHIHAEQYQMLPLNTRETYLTALPQKLILNR